MGKKSVRDIDVAGKRVLVRVDFNVPLDKTGNVSDDTRIRAALPTIRYLIEKRARIILVSHLGRPKGVYDEKFSLKPVAGRLEELLGQKVALVEDLAGEVPRKAAQQLQDGEVMMLENIRFKPEETKNDEKFARSLAELADVFVNDAFGTAHRAHASTEGVAHFIPAVAGFLVEKEVSVLGKIISGADRPFVAISGGAKISDKIGVIGNLMDKVDTLIIGGGMANTFLRAKGFDLGKSLLESDKVDLAKELMNKAQAGGVKFMLPVDLVVSRAADPEAERKVVPVGDVPADWMALDIGPESVKQFDREIRKAKTVFWNGPMGVFEMAPFAEGTFKVAASIAESSGTTVIGGGDSVSAVKKTGLADRITHISTGGGAALEFLEGKTLPGVAMLQEK